MQFKGTDGETPIHGYSKETATGTGRHLMIREARASDATAALEYIDHVSRESDFLTFGPGEFGRSLSEVAGYMENCLAASNALYLLALIDEQIVGSLIFSGGPRPRVRHTGEFSLSVLREHWGQGVASSLIDALIEWARSGNLIKKINLSVRVDNFRAIELYQRKGFVVEGRAKKVFYLDGIYYDNYWMGLEI